MGEQIWARFTKDKKNMQNTKRILWLSGVQMHFSSNDRWMRPFIWFSPREFSRANGFMTSWWCHSNSPFDWIGPTSLKRAVQPRMACSECSSPITVLNSWGASRWLYRTPWGRTLPGGPSHNGPMPIRCLRGVAVLSSFPTTQDTKMVAPTWQNVCVSDKHTCRRNAGETLTTEMTTSQNICFALCMTIAFGLYHWTAEQKWQVCLAVIKLSLKSFSDLINNIYYQITSIVLPLCFTAAQYTSDKLCTNDDLDVLWIQFTLQ